MMFIGEGQEEQIVNIIPLPPVIVTNNLVKDLLAVDAKCQRNINKKYKEAIEEAFSIGKKKRIYKKKKKAQELVILPLIHNRCLNHNRYFYLYGGIILPCDFSYEARMGIHERGDFIQSCRPLVQIEKKRNYSIITYAYNFKGLENFDFLIDIYARKGKQNYYNLAQILKQFQTNIQLWKKESQLLSPRRLTNPDEYKEKYQTFMEECLRRVDQLDQSKFYVFGMVAYNYENNNLETRSVGFSKGFLSLLGTDQEQFNNIILRCGESFFTAGEVLINALIVSLLPLACSNLIYQKSAAHSMMVSFDGFEIPYKEIRSYYLPEENHHLGYFEIGFGLIEYDVSITVLQQLLTMRAKRYYVDKIKEFENISDETFEYTMNSQLFMEKYYPNAITNEFLRCRYKYMSEQGEQTNNLEVITSISAVANNTQRMDDSVTRENKPNKTSNYSSFLDISEYQTKSVITPDDIEKIVKENKLNQQEDITKYYHNPLVRSQAEHSGLGYSVVLPQSGKPSFNEKSNVSLLSQENELGQSGNFTNCFTNNSEIEMEIEPFQYFENYSTTDAQTSQKQSIISESEINQGQTNANIQNQRNYHNELYNNNQTSKFLDYESNKEYNNLSSQNINI